MNFGDLKTLCRLYAPHAKAAKLSEANMTIIINQGVKEICAISRCLATNETFTATAGDDDYSLSTVNNVTSITFITGGSGGIVATDVIHVTADNVAYNDIRIEAFIDSILEGQLRFVSRPANGLAYIYTFHKVSLLTSGDFALKSAEEFTTVSFEGDMLSSELITGEGESKLFKIEGSEVT